MTVEYFTQIPLVHSNMLQVVKAITDVCIWRKCLLLKKNMEAALIRWLPKVMIVIMMIHVHQRSMVINATQNI